MITNLTQIIMILKSKMKKTKRALKEHILDFVFLSSFTGKCVLCDKPIRDPANSSGEVSSCEAPLEQIEAKLCRMCIVRVHTDEVLFPLKLDVPDQFKECQNFLEHQGLQQYESPEVACLNDSRSLCVTDLGKLHADMCAEPESQETYSIPKMLSGGRLAEKMAESFRSKVKRDRIRLFKLHQIKYKLGVVAEQIEAVQANHRSAVESGRFEDAEKFRVLFHDLWCAKIDLEERLVRSGGSQKSSNP